MGIHECPHELLLEIFEALIPDYPSLHSCTLVNHQCNRAASKVLYTRIVYSPRSDERTLSLGDRGKLSEPSAFVSSMLPRNAIHVQRLEISGDIPTRTPPFNQLQEKLPIAIHAYRNLRAAVFTPASHCPNTFTEALLQLQGLPCLEELEVNSSCADERRAPLLVGIPRLTKLTLRDPPRAILQLLPEWLPRLKESLLCFHLKGNCGSITPGVLRSLIPYLQGIKSFSLGLSYSLADADVFYFLDLLPSLTHVQLQYYLQFNTPKSVPPFPRLRSLSVKHSILDTRQDVGRFSVWIRRIISSSKLESLHLIGDASPSACGASVSFDGLGEHISKRHGPTIRHLNLGSAFLGLPSLRQLCQCCPKLELLRIAVSLDTLTKFGMVSQGLTHLRTLELYVRNTRRSLRNFNDSFISRAFQDAPKSLRRVTVDHTTWEVRRSTPWIYFFLLYALLTPRHLRCDGRPKKSTRTSFL
ncbi:hypothetical protein BDN71DRAFT_1378820 [Pleurotus eryngii]|uniref:F-box domain-containing protein n=1 Tax=Pleurotus eryngii TaxID=5323 RepID=A0A9P6A8Y0_PLEER|nr:hypothetical protein BDN71DRAFT_1378820 [Pleurotus eryngii]